MILIADKMDFSTVLAAAQENKSKSQTSWYSTKFAPPKKPTKQKVLSDNIKKFLAKKEEEQRQKTEDEKRKKENLLSLRDHKAQSRINKHLKVCKAANKAVIADAVDNENTAITIAGPSQPDEDDYGYESQSSLAYYNKLMSQYNSQPPEKSIFSSEKRTVKDIASTKDRVKQALKQQELEETSGERRKRKSSSLNTKESAEIEKTEKSVEKIKEEIKDEKPKVKKKPSAPPAMSFTELLKIAEKKQHEPVMVEVKPKVEEERPMTKRQKKEYMQEKERRERRELELLRTNNATSATSGASNKPPQVVNKSPKVAAAAEKPAISNSISTSKTVSSHAATGATSVTRKLGEHGAAEKSGFKSAIKNSQQHELLEERKRLEAERKQLELDRRKLEEERKQLERSKREEDARAQSSNKLTAVRPKIDKPTLKDVKPRQFPPADLKPSSLINAKPKQFPPADLKPVKAPKPLVKKPLPTKPQKSKTFSSGATAERPAVTKGLMNVYEKLSRRIYDEDEEESDLDGFIDDGPEEDEYSKNISKHISEIFGYDKNRYADDDDDDDAMESNYAQQLKEEYVSTKIGIMEDLEDMKMEALEKKKKALLTKKNLKK